ncbi:hypothetical protein HYPSUDRAFT_61971 [Hypholoma sublateritium FD-334 SS-4]|uniref:Uncharacterized protein n=1 Tax=Hypholoma sublateritium (strain FD-334 SS-4) TaxID=945553 RepID=A0A0D2PBU9_HYPSF|nr:hypothetical protein HYPSUDRAFT_61971 [Hypholoma sublateritium FD-334 SS-4]
MLLSNSHETIQSSDYTLPHLREKHLRWGLPAMIRENPRAPKSYTIANLDSSYTSKLFKAELSPILEDSRHFSEIHETKQESMHISAIDSSGSSYGQLLPEGETSFFQNPGMTEQDTDQADVYFRELAQEFGDFGGTSIAKLEFYFVMLHAAKAKFEVKRC